MITPLDIENKKFSKRTFNGYSTEEVDDFLDELTIAYEKLYKEVADSKQTIDGLNAEIKKYRSMEGTLQNTLLMAQSTAEEVKTVAKQQADIIINEAQNAAKQELLKINSEIKAKEKEIEDLDKQFEVYKSKMESLLVAQLDMLKNSSNDKEKPQKQ